MTPSLVPLPPPAAPRKKSSALWIVIPILCAIPVLLLLLLGGLAYLYAKSGEQLAATAQDRAVVIDAAALAAHVPGLAVDPAKEQLKKERNAFGVVTVSYEYEGQPALYVKSSATFDKTASDAKTSYGGARLGLEGYLAATGKLQTVARDDLLRWGDESRSSLLVRDGKPLGNFFIARKGGRVFMLMTAGIYFDDPALMSELLRPRLEAMERHAVAD